MYFLRVADSLNSSMRNLVLIKFLQYFGQRAAVFLITSIISGSIKNALVSFVISAFLSCSLKIISIVGSTLWVKPLIKA